MFHAFPIEMSVVGEITERPTILVVSPLYREKNKGLSVSQWEITDVIVKLIKGVEG